jgi:hypothetical protein
MNKTRACLFNLIVYIFDPKQKQYFKQLIQLITDQFPCRLIYIQENESSQQSYLNVITSEKEERSGLPSDQILIEVGGNALSRVLFLILPSLVPDLPIYLLWGKDPISEHPLLSQLQKFSTRFIYDPTFTTDFKVFIQNILSVQENINSSLMDLNWVRIGSWREIMSQVFDSPERLQQLTNARLIKITYNNHSTEIPRHLDIQAIYFQAWLAAQLEWEFEKIEKKKDQWILYYQQPPYSICIILEPQIHENLPFGEIVNIEISDQMNYFCSMERQADQVVVHCSTAYQCELPFKLLLPNIYSGKNLIQEIFYQKTSEHYKRMLGLLKTYPSQIE